MSDLTDTIAETLRGVYDWYRHADRVEMSVEAAKAVLAVPELRAALRVRDAIMNAELANEDTWTLWDDDSRSHTAADAISYLRALGRVEPQ